MVAKLLLYLGFKDFSTQVNHRAIGGGILCVNQPRDRLIFRDATSREDSKPLSEVANGWRGSFYIPKNNRLRGSLRAIRV